VSSLGQDATLLGPIRGAGWSLIGATLGAALAFLVGRCVAADRVA